MDDNTKIVEAGYNTVALKYHQGRGQFETGSLLSEFHSLLKPGAHVLDAGCGAGIPVAKELVEAGFAVTGIDLSSTMLELARHHVPEATFHKMDMNSLVFKDEAFGGVVACYSFFHVPASRQPGVLTDFHRILQPGGGLMFTIATGAREGVGQMYGTDIYWSNLAPIDTIRMTEEAGFEIVRADERTCGGEIHFWVYARKPETHNQQINRTIESRGFQLPVI